MADSFTFNATTINIADGYDVNIGNIARKVDEIHIDDTDVTFLRDMGLVSGVVTARGTETFADFNSAAVFTAAIAAMEFQSVNIKHDRLTGAGGVNTECLSTNRPSIATNLTPGFHTVWNAQFRIFPS